ncbi:MAG: PilZ domain-containing protein [Phycisphaeraceae bacterium]|nr:PilZ domain-containing protein [Phycisphaeraceae bacterium]MCB9847337.1 PilZ domain-containing protein [Phycisphaeraceae bacterium]
MHVELKLAESEQPRMIWERREHPRVNCCGERLRWKIESARRTRKGWLNDVSTNGMSFLIEQRRAPGAGETLEVRNGQRSEPLRFRVVRTAPEGSDLALVACERTDAPATLTEVVKEVDYKHAA